MKSFGLYLFVIITLIFGTQAYASDYFWGPYRGMTASENLTENDVMDFSNTGGNLLRVGFAVQPLMNKVPPYSFNEDSFVKLNQIIGWARKYKIKIIIDPHTTPGTQRNTTTLPKDSLWQDKTYHELLNKLWDRISKDYKKDSDVIIGYDLLNEPSSKKLPPTPGAMDYNELISQLIQTIRAHDPDMPIIIEPPVGRDKQGNWINRLEGVGYLSIPNDHKIIISPHIYEPVAFTHQGVKEFKIGPEYPGIIDGKYWDKEALRLELEPLRSWQLKHNVNVYIGEFSASSYTGESGTRYIKDLIDLFEEYGWSWSYHSWRSAEVWDAEKIKLQEIKAQISQTMAGAKNPESRLDVLKASFKLNLSTPN